MSMTRTPRDEALTCIRVWAARTAEIAVEMERVGDIEAAAWQREVAAELDMIALEASSIPSRIEHFTEGEPS